MKRIIIESTNPMDSEVDIEEKLEKAVETIRLQREQKELTDLFLKEKKAQADQIVSKVLDSMVDRISEVILGY